MDTAERIQELEIEAARCEECAELFAAGKMVFYTNGIPEPAQEMAAKYRQFADTYRELIALYKEQSLR